MSDTEPNNRPIIHLAISRCSIPFFFAHHAFFVVECSDSIHRYEVHYFPNKKLLHYQDGKLENNYIHIDTYSGLSGLRIINFLKKPTYTAKIIHTFTANNFPNIDKLQQTIESSVHDYPWRNQYNLLGKNSNTYIWWILKQCDDASITLPWTCFGERP